MCSRNVEEKPAPLIDVNLSAPVIKRQVVDFQSLPHARGRTFMCGGCRRLPQQARASLLGRTATVKLDAEFRTER